MSGETAFPPLASSTPRMWPDRVGACIVVQDSANFDKRLGVYGRTVARAAYAKYLADHASEVHVHAFEACCEPGTRTEVLSESPVRVTWTTHCHDRTLSGNVDALIGYYLGANLQRFSPDALILASGDGGFTPLFELVRRIERLSGPMRVGALAVPGSASRYLVNYLGSRFAFVGEDLLSRKGAAGR